MSAPTAAAVSAAHLALAVRPVPPAGPLKDYSEHYGAILGWTVGVIVLVFALILWGWTARRRRSGARRAHRSRASCSWRAASSTA